MDMERSLSTTRLAKAATGLTAVEFEALAEVFSALWTQSRRRRTAAGTARQRQPGGGCKGQLCDPRRKLVFILFGRRSSRSGQRVVDSLNAQGAIRRDGEGKIELQLVVTGEGVFLRA